MNNHKNGLSGTGQNLFDMPLNEPINTEIETPQETEDTDFFDKIEDIKVDDSILGDEVTTKIHKWVDEYKAFNEEIKKLEAARDAYSAFVDESTVFGLKDDDHFRRYVLEDLKPVIKSEYDHAVLEPKDKLFAKGILTLVKDKWGVELSDEEILKEVDLEEAATIIDFIAERINFGDTEGLLFQQDLDAFANNWVHREFQVKGKKVFVSDTFWFSDYDMDYGHLSWEHEKKFHTLWKLLSIFHEKEKGFSWQSIDACFQFYFNRPYVKECFEKLEASNQNKDEETISSIKLFKNGKFEMTFHDASNAQKFYDEYIAKAMLKSN